MNKKQKLLLIRCIVTAVLMIVLHFIPAGGILRFVLYLVPYGIIGYDILRKAWKGIRNRRVFDENFLMAVATIGALVIGLVDNDDYVEAVAVMLFYQIGEFFQSYAVGISRRNISALMDIRPDYANVEREGRLEQVDPDEVEIGTEIIVRPGEKVPIDGIVTEGSSSLNTSALTGESLPRDIGAGEEIFSGCINMTGVLKIRTTKEFGESTVSKVLDLVENASSRKSRSEDFISKFARIYTPAVCYSALALAFVPPLIGLLLPNASPNWTQWVYRALAFLVASCPCALVISIPLSFFAGIGGASKEGVLVKGSNFLEALSRTGYVVFDKTGTLTQGVFEVTAVHLAEGAPEESRVMELAAYAESASSHPISKSIRSAYGKDIDPDRVAEIREISGGGVVALVDGLEVAAGNAKLMNDLGIPFEKKCELTGTIVHVAIDREYAGHILISDKIKPTSVQAIRSLKASGIKETIMLTGDTRAVAEDVAREIGINRVYAELLPGDKVDKVEELLNGKQKNYKLAFVGDGINDAPVLSRADIGIAMGAMGSDAAIEAADVVLMDDDPMKIVKAIRISRKCLRIVRENTVFAIAVKILALILVALGIANMWIAVFADVGVMIIAVLNAIRALFVRNL